MNTTQKRHHSPRLHSFITFVGIPLLLLAQNTTTPAGAACVAPPSAMAAWWQGEGDATDSTGAINGILHNGVTFASGEAGRCFRFDGVSSYVQIPSSPVLTLTNEFTIEFWYQDGGVPPGSYAGLVAKRGPGPCNFGISILGGTPATLVVYLLDSNYGSYQALNYPGLPTTGGFHHLAATFSQTSAEQIRISAFVDGQSAQTSTVTGNLARTLSDDPVTIGCSNPTGEFFKGSIDELSIYKRVLSSVEIASIYGAGISGKCSTPIAPSIITQPASQTVVAHTTVTLSVEAAGSAPLSYQWTFNGASLPGATDATLILANIQESKSGQYAVRVANSVSSVLSTTAALTVNPAPSCAAPSPSLLSWWQAEGDAADATGFNAGTAHNGITFPSGVAGRCFHFDGVSSYIQIPDHPSLSLTNEFTIEFWYQDNGIPAGAYAGLVAKRGGGPCNFGISIIGGTPGTLVVYLLDPTYGSYQALNYGGLPSGSDFHHLAATFTQVSSEQIQISAFVDGQPVQTSTLPGNLARTTSSDPITIGCSNPGGEFFKGNIDELTIYRKALSSNEIGSIYTAGISGKCLTPTGPSIITQPTSQTVVAGTTVTLSVEVAGTGPLSYQWSRNGVSLTGATEASLVFSNVQKDQGGQYSVRVVNSVSSVVSSTVTLIVNPPPSCSAPPADLLSWWRAEDDANDTTGLNNGTVHSGVTFSNGEAGRGFNFDGLAGYIQIPDSPSLNLTNEFTIEFWYQQIAAGSGTYQGLVAKRGGGPCNFGISIVAGTPQTLVVYLLDPNYGSYQALNYVGLPSTGFHHLAATFNQTSAEQIQITAFVDGQSVQTSTVSGNLSRTLSGDPVTIGCSNPGGEFFKGNLDELAIYRRALSANEIASIYASGLSGKCVTQIAPSIVTQPASQTVVAGMTATFSVAAAGTGPLSYQWRFNGANLQGATDSVLILSNVKAAQSGQYSVRVVNSAGSIVSSSVSLAVNPAPPCAAPPAGLLSWWRAEDDAKDSTSMNNGIAYNGVTFSTGEAGRAFNFDGTSSYILIPDSPSLNLTNEFTIEFWCQQTGLPSGPYQGLVAKRGGGPCNFGISIVSGTPQTLVVYLLDPSYGAYQALSYAGLPNSGFHHLAATFIQTSAEQIQISAFVDGQLVQTSTVPGNLGRTLSSDPVTIGASNSGGEFFRGTIDELSIYRKALSPAEVTRLYDAGVSGKCNTPIAPSILVQPQNQTVVSGSTVSFSVEGAGTGPLSYQWSFNGVNIPWATNEVLTLQDVQRSQAGAYSVVIANATGSILSSNAALKVNFPPATVQVVNSSGTAGQIVSVPVTLAANGNENAIGFSLAFDPSVASYVGCSLGSGANGGYLLVNTNQVAFGSIGVAVSLPSAGTFILGSRELVEIHFALAASSKSVSSNLSFSDQPTRRELADVDANELSATFVDGHVEITSTMLEADVAGRPSGDGAVSIVDWVQVGRFVSLLSSPTNDSEFQRADCAPRESLGDGRLSVSDWVQAGRYAAGMDPIMPAGGPTGPIAGVDIGSLGSHPRRGLSTTGVALRSPATFVGGTITAVIELQACGEENAVGLSLAFDPSLMSCTGVRTGANALAATMMINANRSGSGQLGVVLALPPGSSFSAGTNQIVEVDFHSLTDASTNSVIKLTDLPVRREIADIDAINMNANYVGGIITLNPRPALEISKTERNITLTWPLWATNYVLQEAIGTMAGLTNWTKVEFSPVMTGGNPSVSLPASGSAQYFRLISQP